MKKNIMKSIKILGLCLVLSLFVGVVVVDAQTAPANNVAGPLNSGSSYQTKVGSLRLTNGGFRSAGPGLFDDIVVVGYSSSAEESSSNASTTSQSYLDKNKSEGIFSKLAKFFGLKTETAMAVESTGNVGQTGGLGLKTPPSCGTATSHSYTTAPTNTPYTLCSSGANNTAVQSNGDTLWSWMCFYPSAPGVFQTCNAINIAPPHCGTSNGGTFQTAPTSGLCDAASDLSGSVVGSGADIGYWKWSCVRTNITGAASCSADKGLGISTGGATGGISVPLSATYRFTVNGRSNLNGYTKVEGDLDVAGVITSGGKNICLQDGTNCSAGQTIPSSNLFGGTFTKRSDNNVGINKNPFTNDYTCPADFTPYLMAEYTYIDNFVASSGGSLVGTAYRIKMFGCLHI